ncbi:hypothetical protein AUEXF2481DRAFT_442 [Aureobasidium subglaciale EXF-2481]|uniref:Uncharacterized protein n=1 Tax=Aureobasidium subglaciale (strain EXF-2481) TaxID=1043005 RepID=A0A074Z2E4_AURSE|nr:uncharacterized protein AUEXF2481DRAFT_442 [Aureobasidium subglaciale EXF-2481]KER00518.1 hypothetical protein AUEXF2481DRAFT_442 [Aureobasidium subglaciale EXF-2481]
MPYSIPCVRCGAPLSGSTSDYQRHMSSHQAGPNKAPTLPSISTHHSPSPTERVLDGIHHIPPADPATGSIPHSSYHPTSIGNSPNPSASGSSTFSSPTHFLRNAPSLTLVNATIDRPTTRVAEAHFAHARGRAANRVAKVQAARGHAPRPCATRARLARSRARAALNQHLTAPPPGTPRPTPPATSSPLATAVPAAVRAKNKRKRSEPGTRPKNKRACGESAYGDGNATPSFDIVAFAGPVDQFNSLIICSSPLTPSLVDQLNSLEI